MFSVVLERKLHPEQEKSEESDVCRSRLQLFHLAGGASRTDLRGSVTGAKGLQNDKRHQSSPNHQFAPSAVNLLTLTNAFIAVKHKTVLKEH